MWRKTLNGNNTTLRVFVGWDSREDIAFQACKQSLLTAAKYPNNLEIYPLKLDELRVIARAVPSPLRWAAVWFLLWIEPQYIEYKSQQAVDDAIRQYKKTFGQDKVINMVIENTKPSKVKGLNDQSITYHSQLDEEYWEKYNHDL